MRWVAKVHQCLSFCVIKMPERALETITLTMTICVCVILRHESLRAHTCTYTSINEELMQRLIVFSNLKWHLINFPKWNLNFQADELLYHPPIHFMKLIFTIIHFQHRYYFVRKFSSFKILSQILIGERLYSNWC